MKQSAMKKDDQIATYEAFQEKDQKEVLTGPLTGRKYIAPSLLPKEKTACDCATD